MIRRTIFTDEEPEGDRVISGGGPRLPQGGLRGEQGCHLLPVVEIFHCSDWLSPRGEPRSATHHLADLDALLTAGCEFRPVFGDGSIEVQLAPISEEQRRERSHGFRRGINGEDGVLLPRTGFLPGLLKPSQRSTTVSPSRVAQQEAPTSAPLAKFTSKASRTGLNLSLTKPCTLFSGIHSPPFVGVSSKGPKYCPRRLVHSSLASVKPTLQQLLIPCFALLRLLQKMASRNSLVFSMT